MNALRNSSQLKQVEQHLYQLKEVLHEQEFELMFERRCGNFTMYSVIAFFPDIVDASIRTIRGNTNLIRYLWWYATTAAGPPPPPPYMISPMLPLTPQTLPITQQQPIPSA
ncbi:hypothetical protein PTKIN_Ptkin08bG0152100 [Pterospermum kingtungense]